MKGAYLGVILLIGHQNTQVVDVILLRDTHLQDNIIHLLLIACILVEEITVTGTWFTRVPDIDHRRSPARDSVNANENKLLLFICYS
ncbi:hypothetical protein ZEAMMB73_Zm00001d053618 [Zea mays]|uniref:Uncharacterized protein n=1 Tax=Zea mays TaxID=4577 RepID=K7UR18_MAIZE|nr:hypothetical protein ZEAMMB73_Zm00001d053618 [Zea mays]